MDFLIQFFSKFTIRDLIDIFLIAILLYYFLLLIRGTRAVQILQGVGILLLLLLFSYYLKLNTIYWILHYSLMVIVVAIPIVFQPELRRALGYLGRGSVFVDSFLKLERGAFTKLVDEIAWAVSILAQTKTGALIVLEKETGLEEFIETGTKVDAEVSSKLLLSIFMPKSPLHDGAVIIRGNRVISASSYLPLSENVTSSGDDILGSRHRAALGLSEQTDAVVIVVSEEKGTISVALNGKLTRNLDEEKLKKLLTGIYTISIPPSITPIVKFRKIFSKK